MKVNPTLFVCGLNERYERKSGMILKHSTRSNKTKLLTSTKMTKLRRIQITGFTLCYISLEIPEMPLDINKEVLRRPSDIQVWISDKSSWLHVTLGVINIDVKSSKTGWAHQRNGCW